MRPRQFNNLERGMTSYQFILQLDRGVITDSDDEGEPRLTVFASRWQALLGVGPEAGVRKSVEGPVEVPPGLQREEVVEVQDSNAAMAADGSERQQESYAHMFVDSFGDLEALEQTFADQEPAEENERLEGTKVEEPLSEYGVVDSEAESGTTIPTVDQWEHENADVLNQDEYGFGLEQDIDDDDIRLFGEAVERSL
eukprot:1720496-Amphidinium_carterae.1